MSDPNPKFNLTIVGLGLIGGSIGLDLSNSPLIGYRTGVDKNQNHQQIALQRGIVDKISNLDSSIENADIVLLALPVNIMAETIEQVLNLANSTCVVIDTGSTKSSICKHLSDHPKRNQFVATHPLAGTENSGPQAAMARMFEKKVTIICEKEKSSSLAIEVANTIFEALGMKIIFMDPEEHDIHVAYVSHLSHVSSFLLGQTVLDIEKDKKNIFNLAGSGFASTVRLAKSSPEMWVPIFEQNAVYLNQALSEYIIHLQKFQNQLINRNVDGLNKILNEANKIRKVLEGITP